MNLRYWLKSAIKDILLFRCKRRYENYLNVLKMESSFLPNGVDIGGCDYDIFILVKSKWLFRINNW